jgi:hypothetical protein
LDLIAGSGGGFIRTKDEIKTQGETPTAPEQQAPQFSEAQIRQFKNYNGNSIPEEYKAPRQKSQFLDNYSQWTESNPTNFNKEEQKSIATAFDDLASKSAPYKSYDGLRANASLLQDTIELLKE